MRSIRDYLNLFEAPVDDYQLHGDFSKNGTLVGKDRELVSKPKHEIRVRKLLNKTPFKINVNLWNYNYDNESLDLTHRRGEGEKTILNAADYIGQYSLTQVNNILKLDIKYDASAITFILAGNDRGEDTLSAWMIVHRFMHAIEDASTSLYGYKADKDVNIAYEYFNDLIEDFNKGTFRDELLTTKSANNMTNSDEVMAELMTQYLVKGKVTLRNETNKEAVVRFEAKINESLKDLFRVCVGKIFVIF